MALGRVICAFLGHKRVRQQVWSDGSNWRCDCARCGTALMKRHGGTWRPLGRSTGNRS